MLPKVGGLDGAYTGADLRGVPRRRGNPLGSQGGPVEPSVDLAQNKFSKVHVHQIESWQHLFIL